MAAVFLRSLCILVTVVGSVSGSCPFAQGVTSNSEMMHSELFHKFVRTAGKSLDLKAFEPSQCKLPNPDNYDREQLDKFAIEQGMLAPIGSLPANHLRAVKADNKSLGIGLKSLKEIDFYRLVQAQKKTLTKQEKEERACKKPSINCDENTLYRTYDGECNNLLNPSYGQAHMAFSRLLDPDYSDELSDPRIGKGKTPLPSPRLVSSTVINEITREFPELALIATSFGQFVAHDVTLAVSFRAANDRIYDCCKAAEQKLFLAECIPIDVATDDQFYSKFNVTCLSAMRTMVAEHSYCNGAKPVRQQINQVTSFLDASVVYGANADIALPLREMKKGKLKIAGDKGISGEFPTHGNNINCQEDLSTGKICIQDKVGDIRGDEQPLITTQQVIFLRFHNYLAKQLQIINPNWNDETLYQESRRLLIACYQHVIYKEFLPAILGTLLTSAYKLKLVSSGFYTKYNASMDPTLFNEFGAAAYRYGHATVPGLIKVVEPTKLYENQRLSDMYLTFFETKLMDEYVRGFVNQRAELVDNGLTRELSNNLFIKEGLFGHDLASLNINRGRDHGLPGYNKYRVLSGSKKLKSFEDLKKVMDPAVADLFQAVYKSVDDIDLWAAGISENVFPGAIVGPTFAYIIGTQFRRLREGDRFWYENGGMSTSFELDQLNEIRKMSMSGILCQVSGIKNIQPNAMHLPSDTNVIKDCSKYPKIDFEHWKDWNSANNYDV